MENALNIILSTENVRTLAIIVSVFCGAVWIKISLEHSLSKRIDGVESSLNKRIDGVESSLSKRIDGVESSIKELKYNDFAHLKGTLEALTFVLERNGSLSEDDKKYVDSRYPVTV